MQPGSTGLHRALAALLAAWRHFNGDDGWAIASHVTLTGILALFPFLIFCTAVAAYLELGDFPETAVHLVFDAWPAGIAQPVADEIRNVLTVQRGDILTFGAIAALFFASSGVEALRLGLNRAYQTKDTRHFLLLRLQSLIFVAIAALAIASVALFIVVVPLAGSLARKFLPQVVDQIEAFGYWRHLLSGAVLTVALIASHKWLPGGRRSLAGIVPGIGLTLTCWLVTAQIFAIYLRSFADYVDTYAGLAGVVVALVFVYLMSAIFLFGAEFNGALARSRARTGN
jgi:membrane protein